MAEPFLEELEIEPPRSAYPVALDFLVMAYSPAKLPATKVPERWNDLDDASSLMIVVAKTDWKRLFQLPAVQALVVARAQETGPLAGVRGIPGNPARMLDKKEDTLAILKLSQALQAIQSGAPVKVIYPLDGAPMMSLNAAASPKNNAAKRAFDWLYSVPAQLIFIRHGYYSPLEKIVHPDHGREWKRLKLQIK